MAPPIDEPPAATCPVCGPDQPCQLGGMAATTIPALVLNTGPGPDNMNGTADDLPLGPNACGADGASNCDFFDVPTAGANNGKKTFILLAGLPDDLDGDGTNDLNQAGAGFSLVQVIEIVANNGTFLTGNQTLSTAPDAWRSSALLATPDGTTPFQALTYIAVEMGQSIVDVYAPTSGTLNVKAIDVSGDTPNSLIQIDIASTNLAESDGTAFIQDGCTTTAEGLSVTLKQGNPTFAKPMTADQSAGRQLRRDRAMAIYNGIKNFHK